MSDWKEYRLEEVADIIGGGTPKTEVPEYWNGLIPWITPRDLSNSKERYILRGERNISEAGLTSSSAKLIPKGSVLLSSRAPVGYLAISDCVVTTNQGFRSLVPLPDRSDTTFLFYLLKANVDFLISQASGTTFQELAGGVLKELSFLFPPLSEQRAIAAVLSSQDDKIDLLHRQNKTLEGMAEALWRKMFVEEADRGWEKGKLGDLIELCYGKGLKEEKRIFGKYPVLGSSGIVGYHNEFLVKGPGIVIGRKGTLGLVNYIEHDFFPIDTTYYIKSKTNSGRLFFEYFLLKAFSFEDMNSDSAVPGLNRDIAQSIECVIPSIGGIQEFNSWCHPLFIKMTKNHRQISTLSRLRDTLLPKLMSGEVRVRI